MPETDDNIKKFASHQVSGEFKKEYVYYTINEKQCKRQYVVPFDPKTAVQIELRTKFAQAVSDWKGLTPEQKKLWNLQASYKDLNMSGYNLFISNQMKV